MSLAKHFLPDRDFSYEAEQALLCHSWPGNVRELENSCKRVSVLKPDGVIDAKDFAFASSTIQSKRLVNEPDKQALEEAMRVHQGVIARVARQFGLSRQALYRRLVKFEIDY
jgi:transcriptional regulator of acetoin/glycerol metabolism